MEAPLDERLALLGAARSDRALGLELAGKTVLLRSPEHVAALQAGVFWSEAPDPACQAEGGEVRGLYGYSFGAQFLNIELAGRRSGGCDAVRLEGAWGWRVDAQWLTMLQVFTHRDDGGVLSTTLQASAVAFNAKGRGVQLGVRWREAEGAAVVVALWDRMEAR